MYGTKSSLAGAKFKLCMQQREMYKHCRVNGGVCRRHGATLKLPMQQRGCKNEAVKVGWCVRHGAKRYICICSKMDVHTNQANNNNGGGGVCPNEIKMSSKKSMRHALLAFFFVLLPMILLTFRAAIFHEIAIITHFFNLMLSTPVMPQYAQQQQCIIFSHTAAQLSRSYTNRIIRNTTGRNNNYCYNKMQQ